MNASIAMCANLNVPIRRFISARKFTKLTRTSAQSVWAISTNLNVCRYAPWPVFRSIHSTWKPKRPCSKSTSACKTRHESRGCQRRQCLDPFRAGGLGTGWFAGVNLHHGFFHVALHQQICRFDRACNALVNQFSLFGHRLFKHPIGHL
jgi:hypothetical protein